MGIQWVNKLSFITFKNVAIQQYYSGVSENGGFHSQSMASWENMMMTNWILREPHFLTKPPWASELGYLCRTGPTLGPAWRACSCCIPISWPRSSALCPFQLWPLAAFALEDWWGSLEDSFDMFWQLGDLRPFRFIDFPSLSRKIMEKYHLSVTSSRVSNQVDWMSSERIIASYRHLHLDKLKWRLLRRMNFRAG